jgi:tetratricopeptide (TPR) repeat protein
MINRLRFALSLIVTLVVTGCGPDESLTRFQKQAEEHPNDWMALVNLSRAYEDRGNYAESIRVTEKLLTLKPEEHWVYAQLAMRYTFNGQFDKATQALEKALSLAEKAGPEAVQSTTQLRDGINLFIHATPDERKELKVRMKMK